MEGREGGKRRLVSLPHGIQQQQNNHNEKEKTTNNFIPDRVLAFCFFVFVILIYREQMETCSSKRRICLGMS